MYSRGIGGGAIFPVGKVCSFAKISSPCEDLLLCDDLSQLSDD